MMRWATRVSGNLYVRPAGTVQLECGHASDAGPGAWRWCSTCRCWQKVQEGSA